MMWEMPRSECSGLIDNGTLDVAVEYRLCFDGGVKKSESELNHA